MAQEADNDQVVSNVVNTNDELKNDGQLAMKVNYDANNRLHVSVLAPHFDGSNSNERLPANICCVVDVSGSMDTAVTIKDANGKTESHGLTILDLVKHSIKTIIHCLNPKDRVSIVSYSNNATVVAQTQLLTENNKKTLLAQVEKLHAGGGTNLWGGLEAGLEQLRAIKDISYQNSGVLLFTDGLPNVRPPNGELGSLDKYIKTHEQLPAIINTYGFGYSLDSQLLCDLARKANGNYFFIPDSSFVGTIFVNSISNFVCNSVKDVKLKIKVSNNNNCSVLGGYEFSMNNNSIDVALGSLMFDQNKDVIIQFNDDGKVDDAGPGAEENEGQADDANNNNNDNNNNNNGIGNGNYTIDENSLEYVSIKQSKSFGKAKECEIVGNNDNNAQTETNINYYRLKAVDTMNGCMESLQLNDTNEAQTSLKDFIKSINADNTVKNIEIIKDLLKDLKGQVFEAIESKDAYNKWGKHYLLSLIMAHLHKYNNNFKDPGVQHYGGDLFKQIKDAGDNVFVSLPAPKPSKPVYVGGANGQPKQQKKVNIHAYYNQHGGCIAEHCNVLMADYSLKMVEKLVSGDKIISDMRYGTVSEIKCVIRIKCLNNEMKLSTLPESGLKITPWHPIKLDNKWVFPNNIDNGRIEHCNFVYNFVLNNTHVMVINGIKVCSLGHNIKENNVIEHSYFGTNKVINDLKQFGGWSNGYIELNSNSFKRNKNDYLVNGIGAQQPTVQI